MASLVGCKESLVQFIVEIVDASPCIPHYASGLHSAGFACAFFFAETRSATMDSAIKKYGAEALGTFVLTLFG